MFIHFQENLSALRDFNTIGSGCPDEMSTFDKLVCLLEVVLVTGERPNFAVIERCLGLSITPIKEVGPGLGYNVIPITQLQEKSLVPGQILLFASISKLEASLFVNLSFAEKEISESQASCASSEPPGIHGMESIAGFEEVNSKRHEEVVEQKVHRKLKHWFVR